MHAALRENVGHRVAHQLADAQLALRAAGRGTFFLMMAGHNRVLKSLVMPAFDRASICLSFESIRRGWPEKVRP